MGDGDDTITVTGRPTTPPANSTAEVAPLTLNVNGGNPSASDTIEFTGTADQNDSYENSPGALSGSGTAVVTLYDSPATTVNYSNTEAINIDGGGGTGEDVITLNGTVGNDVVTLTATGAVAGNGDSERCPGNQLR